MKGFDGEDYRQCELQKDDIIDRRLVRRRQVAWIPSKFAAVGNVIKLRCPAGLWIDGWEVMAVFSVSTLSVASIEKSRRRFEKVLKHA